MDKNRNLRISKLLNLTEAQSETMNYLNLIADVYKNNFDLNTLQKVFTKGFNNLKAIKGIQDDEEYQKALAAVNTMLAANKQQSTGQALPTQETSTNEETESKVAENSSEGTKQAQSATGNGEAPANPQKSEEIAKKADEIPPQAGQQVNNEYWHKVWTSLSNKAGSLNGQEELQKVVNNFVTELGRIVNK